MWWERRCAPWSARRLGDAWLNQVPGIRRQEPLTRHSWYRIGGIAEHFLEAGDDEILSSLIPKLRADRVPYRILGLGSNTLFLDQLHRGLTIKMATQCLRVDGETVSVCAGYLMPRLALETAKAGRSGLEFGAGVPGTVGGSVFGNAGAFGTEVKDVLVSVTVIDADGRRRSLPAAECAFGYRDSAFKHGSLKGVAIIAASFAVRPDAPSAIRDRIGRVQKHRRETQPVDRRSLGSTFKNPPGDAAGRLIEACGLKGRRIGGAQISAKHANFIINLGGASAGDVLALMAEMRARVRERFGIELEPEIQVIGEHTAA